MKYDAARTSAIFQKLGDSDFAGPNGEGRIADFVAGEFERMGWRVERREVEGSRFPQRVGPWLAWLGYGVLITVSFCMIVSGNLRSQLLAILMIFLAIRWPEALAGNWIRPGRRIRPVEKAPLVIASADGDLSSPRRVVFQAVLGGLDTGFLGTFRVNRFFFLSLLHLGLLVSAFFTFVSMSGYPVIFLRLMVVVTSVIIAFVWVIILCVLSWEYRKSRSTVEVRTTDRLSTALLLELARSWPRHKYEQLEPIFIVGGGQRLNYAGSREVIRMLESEWPRKHSLLLLLFAPGSEAGAPSSDSVVRIAALFGPGEVLAKKAAESLWIPHRSDYWALPSLWPFDKLEADEAIALIGSDLRDEPIAQVSPESLQRAAQLATEIALRWAKSLGETASNKDTAGPDTEMLSHRNKNT